MRFTSYLDRLCRHLRRRLPSRRPPSARPRIRPGLEGLETRTLPATLSVYNGVLTYVAGVGVTNDLEVTYNSSTHRYEMTDTETIIFGPGILAGVGGGTRKVSFSDANIASMRLFLGDMPDRLKLMGTADPTSVFAGQGNDQLNVGGYINNIDYSEDGSLDAIRAPVTVHGEDGDDDQLWVHDWKDTDANTYTITDTNTSTSVASPVNGQVSRAGATIKYGGSVELVRLSEAGTSCNIYVESTSALTDVMVSLKAGGADTVTVGSPAGSLDTIHGEVSVAGEVGQTGVPQDTVIVNDCEDTGANTYSLRTEYYTRPDYSFPLVEGHLSRNGEALLTYTGGLKDLRLYAGSGNDRIDVLSTAALAPTAVYGGAGNDTIVVGGGAASILGPLKVYGQDGNDYLYGGAGNDTMWGGNGRDVLKGMGGDDWLVGDAGDDKLGGGDGNDTLWGLDGHDHLIGGAGADKLYGGYGDDTLVTIDAGTSDYADGQDGHDTVWSDLNWVWNGWTYSPTYDTASAEKCQAVASFANGADRTLNGDGIADPTDGTNYKNFRDNPLFATGGPSADDVDQEALGDCWMLASAGAVAADNPGHIRSMIADFGDGTYGVALGNRFYRIDGDLPTWNASSTDQRFAGLGHEGSLWVAILEKAYTHHRTGANTYASLSGGDPADAMRQFNTTSVGQNYYAAGSNAATVANDVWAHWNAYQSCTICTGSVPNGSPLVGNHCYTVTAVYKDAWGNVTSIVVRNPWGDDNTNGNPYITLTPAQLAACQVWVTWGNT